MRLLPRLPTAVLTEAGAQHAVHGSPIAPGEFSLEPAVELPAGRSRVRLLDATGHLVGIGEPRPGGLLHPAVVLV